MRVEAPADVKKKFHGKEMVLMRRLKKKSALLLDAATRGITSTGGIVRAVYGGTPKDRKVRAAARMLRYRTVGPRWTWKKKRGTPG